jgi:hypothetical protein
MLDKSIFASHTTIVPSIAVVKTRLVCGEEETTRMGFQEDALGCSLGLSL